MAQNSNCSKTSRKNLFKRSPSLQQLKEEMRKQFREKLKIGRNNELCKRRDLYKSILSNVHKHFSDMEERSLEVDSAAEVLDTEDMLRVLVEVEQELYQTASQLQVEQHVIETEEEINAFLHNLNVCTVCNRLTDFQNSSSFICDNCVKLYFRNETF